MAKTVRKQSNDERCVRRLIKRYTRLRRWDLVRALYEDLGAILQEEAENGDLPASDETDGPLPTQG